jgi:hypothetical protein
MRAKSQAIALAELMQRHQTFPEYTLALPPFQVKKKKLKELRVTDIILLGLLEYEFVLLDNFKLCSHLRVENSYPYVTVILDRLIDAKEYDTIDEKFSTLHLVFTTLQSRVLESGHKINITHIDLEQVTLYIDEEAWAKCQLVEVEGELAAEVVEVYW